MPYRFEIPEISKTKKMRNTVSELQERPLDICFFEDPVLSTENGGPYRSSTNDLQLVEFDINNLNKNNRYFVDSLPKGVAIVGGFARGMYLGSMKKVGDIDLAIRTNGTFFCDTRSYTMGGGRKTTNYKKLHVSEILTDFLIKQGYHSLKSSFLHGNDNAILKVFSFCDAKSRYFYNDFWRISVSRFNPNGIISWNEEAIKRKFLGITRQRVDVLLAPAQGISEFLNFFDVSISQFAYLNGQLYATEIALSDIAKNQFRFLCRSSEKRLNKYRKKGYSFVENDEKK